MNSTVPNGYDPVTLFHWLWWKLNCLEGSPQEFQSLFERVATRLRGDFMKVRPYGKLGDRKCDGLYWGDGTVFQVYSPDELKQSQTVSKIEEDLSGAVAEWGQQLKKWVFVYNTRRGIRPDIPQILNAQNKKYPHISIEPLSSDALWELIRDLSLQQRTEILGAPPGYEHMFLLPGAVPEEIQIRLLKGRFVIVQDVLSPINVQDIVKALEPDKPFGPPFHVHPPSVQESWHLAVEYQQKTVEEALQKSRHLLARFAVFSLAPIPLAVHLGYLFSDRVEVKPFQYDRDHKTWRWDEHRTAYDMNFRIEGFPTTPLDDQVDIIVRVSLSARILPSDSVEVAASCPVQIDLFVDNPDVTWLCHENQLTALAGVFRDILRDMNRLVPHCRQIHLFYAGPTGGAIVIGQAINPRMYPPVNLYEYDRKKIPRYEHVLTLK